jgi:hypothetical protein
MSEIPSPVRPSVKISLLVLNNTSCWCLKQTWSLEACLDHAFLKSPSIILSWTSGLNFTGYCQEFVYL